MAPNRRLAFTIALATAIALPLGACVPTPASAQVGSAQDNAFRQQAVDALLGRIRDGVGTSLQTDNWRGRYGQARINIEDLRKALQVGGKISYDPIAPFKAELDALWAERHEYWTFLHGSVIRAQKLSKSASQQAVRDIGGAMMRFLTSPMPGVGQGASVLYNSARKSDADTIRRDFAEIKTAEQAIKTIRGYIDNMKPGMNDLKARRAELVPVHAAFKALMGGGEGTFMGKVMWEHTDGKRAYEGSFKLVVTGSQVKGDFAVLDGKSGDEIRMKRSGDVIGKVNPDGTIDADIKGNSTCVGKCDGDIAAIVKSMLGFPFRGKLEGRLDGSQAGGKYNVHSTDQRQKPVTSQGTWSATRQGG